MTFELKLFGFACVIYVLMCLPVDKWSAAMTTRTEIERKIKAGLDMVTALCAPKYSEGSRAWIMSIPARPDYDPDLVIAAGLQAGRDALVLHSELIEALEKCMPFIDDSEDVYSLFPDSAATKECRDAVQVARAALAKAKGETT